MEWISVKSALPLGFSAMKKYFLLLSFSQQYEKDDHDQPPHTESDETCEVKKATSFEKLHGMKKTKRKNINRVNYTYGKVWQGIILYLQTISI